MEVPKITRGFYADILSRPKSPRKPRYYLYPQQKFGITFHFAWVLGLEWGEKFNYEKTDILLRDLDKNKEFGRPYLATICAENGGWVRYQTLPAWMGQRHRVNFVYSHVYINEQTTLKVWQGHFHCIQCKLMGNAETFKTYNCS